MKHLIGTQIGNFKVTDFVGAGGMGEVYLGEHVVLGHKVAVKVLRGGDLADATRAERSVARFVNEAKLLVNIDSPHIVRVYDFGQLDGGALYYVMEYLDGEDLADVLARRGPLSPADARPFLDQISTALQRAHAAGVVHRDLKPANVFVAREPTDDGAPRVKLIDFGIAKQLAATSGVTVGALGSPLFAAPEQVDPETPYEVGPHSDIYALGVLTYQMLSGALPFDVHGQSNPLAVMLLTARNAPVPLARRAPALSVAMCDLVDACLAKPPSARPPSARAFFEAFAAAVDGDPARALAISARAAAHASTADAPTDGRAVSPTAVQADTPVAQATPAATPPVAATAAPHGGRMGKGGLIAVGAAIAATAVAVTLMLTRTRVGADAAQHLGSALPVVSDAALGRPPRIAAPETAPKTKAVSAAEPPPAIRASPSDSGAAAKLNKIAKPPARRASKRAPGKAAHDKATRPSKRRTTVARSSPPAARSPTRPTDLPPPSMLSQRLAPTPSITCDGCDLDYRSKVRSRLVHRVRYCLERQMWRDKRPFGHLRTNRVGGSLRFSVDPRGRVTSSAAAIRSAVKITPARTIPLTGALLSCFVKIVRQLGGNLPHFPASRGTITVTARYRLIMDGSWARVTM